MAQTAAETGNEQTLSVFGDALDGGLTATTAERFRLSRRATGRVAPLAVRTGFESQVLVARERPPGGKAQYRSLDCEIPTWAARSRCATEAVQLRSKFQVPCADEPSGRHGQAKHQNRRSFGCSGARVLGR